MVNATKDSKRRKAADSRVEVNSKGKKVDWPVHINADTWSTYLQTWNKEKENFYSDWYRCKHLCSAMTDDDKMTFGYLWPHADLRLRGRHSS